MLTVTIESIGQIRGAEQPPGPVAFAVCCGVMKFGIFYELQLPRPWTERSEYQLLQDALAQIELADQLGFDYAWRVELGLGEAQGPVELHPFGQRVRDKREVWEEAVQAIVPAFTKQSWEWHGQHFDFPARNVIPKPFQKPHPPLWVACSNIATIADAGRWGMGALGFQFVSADAARAWVNRYYLELTTNAAKLTDYPTNPNIAMVSGFMCAETDEEALASAAGWTLFVFCLSHYERHGIPNPGESNLWDAYQEWRQTDKARETLRSGLIGSPETIRNRLREFEVTGVDQVILLNQAGRTTPADICKSLALFAREVMPEFHAREAEHTRWKADVLAGRIAISDEGADTYKLYAHQNEDIVRLTPAELKAKMAAKERAAAERS